jgi:hypothetical protein
MSEMLASTTLNGFFGAGLVAADVVNVMARTRRADVTALFMGADCKCTRNRRALHPESSRRLMNARLATRFREALECGGDRATPLGGRGTVRSRRRRKHHTLRVVTIPPPSQSGGLATALQSASHEMAPHPSTTCTMTATPPSPAHSAARAAGALRMRIADDFPAALPSGLR